MLAAFVAVAEVMKKNAFVARINIRDFKLPSLDSGTARLGVPHTGVCQVTCRLWGLESPKRTRREQGEVGS